MSLKIGRTTLGMKPVVCAVFQSPPSDQKLKALARLGVSLVELRIDHLKDKSSLSVKRIARMIKKRGFSVIGTIRIQKEGGSWKFSEEERFQLFKDILPIVDAVDIELQSKICSQVVKAAHAKHKKAIVSFHDFKKTPTLSKMISLVQQANKLKADIVKIAAFAKSKKDFYTLIELTLKHRDRHLISIAMGKIGRPSRVLFPLLGSLVTYGYVGKESASGQFPIEKLAKAFRFSCC